MDYAKGAYIFNHKKYRFVDQLRSWRNEVSWQTYLEQMNLQLGLHNHIVCFYGNILVNIAAATPHGIYVVKRPF